MEINIIIKSSMEITLYINLNYTLQLCQSLMAFLLMLSSKYHDISNNYFQAYAVCHSYMIFIAQLNIMHSSCIFQFL